MHLNPRAEAKKRKLATEDETTLPTRKSKPAKKQKTTAESDGDKEPSTQQTKRKLEDLSSGDEPTKAKQVSMDSNSGDSVVVIPVKKVANGGVYLFSYCNL